MGLDWDGVSRSRWWAGARKGLVLPCSVLVADRSRWFSAEARSLIDRILVPDPKERLTLAQMKVSKHLMVVVASRCRGRASVSRHDSWHDSWDSHGLGGRTRYVGRSLTPSMPLSLLAALAGRIGVRDWGSSPATFLS